MSNVSPAAATSRVIRTSSPLGLWIARRVIVGEDERGRAHLERAPDDLAGVDGGGVDRALGHRLVEQQAVPDVEIEDAELLDRLMRHGGEEIVHHRPRNRRAPALPAPRSARRAAWRSARCRDRRAPDARCRAPVLRAAGGAASTAPSEPNSPTRRSAQRAAPGPSGWRSWTRICRHRCRSALRRCRKVPSAISARIG